jgi:hypothetical protein
VKNIIVYLETLTVFFTKGSFRFLSTCNRFQCCLMLGRLSSTTAFLISNAKMKRGKPNNKIIKTTNLTDICPHGLQFRLEKEHPHDHGKGPIGSVHDTHACCPTPYQTCTRPADANPIARTTLSSPSAMWGHVLPTLLVMNGRARATEQT